MKKTFMGILVLVLSFSLLIGCGRGGDEATPDQDGGQEEVGNLALDQREVDEEITIRFWEKEDPSVDETLDQMIEMFEEENPNITIERTHMETEDLRQNTQTAFMGGQGPHLTSSPFDHVGPFSVMGIAEELDNLISEDMKDRFIDGALGGLSLDGNSYGVPATMGNHLTLLYNKNLVDEAPETWSELIEVAKSLTDGDTYGLAYDAAEPFWWVVFQGGFGGWVLDEDNNPTLDDEATKNAMQFVHDLRFEHGIVPRESDYDLMDSLFKEGKAAFIINGDWSYGSYANDPNIDLGVAPIPMFDETGLYGQPMTSGSAYIMMSELSEKEQIATIKFIDFLTSEEAQNMFIENHMLLPANKHAYDHPLITEDEIMAGSAAQLQNGRPMPVVPEMRAVWDGIRPSLQRVVSGDLDPSEAPAQMQERAEQTLIDMQ